MSEPPSHPLDDEIAVSRWAFALSADERDRLLLAVASVLAAEDLRARARATALLDALLPALARDADADTRRELAHRLPAAPWAPEALLLDLALDHGLDVQAVVARSPALSEPALARLAEQGAPETLIALARRPDLPPMLVELLTEASERLPALRDPLARNPALTATAAARLGGLVGPDLAGVLAARFPASTLPSRAAPDSDARLVEKLHSAGRLTPDYAVNALRRGRPGVFGQAVARLAALAPETVAEALDDEAPGPLALACNAAHLDRAVFPLVLLEARALKGHARDRQPLSPEARAAFDHPPAEAARLLQQAAQRRAARWSAAAGPSA